MLFILPKASAVLLYQTRFELSEGYNTNLDLIGQKGWVGIGSGGNGIVTGFLSGKGQQAYIGFTPPFAGDSSLDIYQPINKNPANAQFTVLMSIFDSTNANYDNFYWVVFNQQGNQLFTLDFDNYELKVYYWLEGATNRIWSGLQFTNGLTYPLNIDINFAMNRWSAVFNRAMIATNQPISTGHSPLNLGDVDAVWGISDANAPGDNFLVFDDYLITASVPPPRLSLLGILNGAATLRVSGQEQASFAIESSPSFASWTPLKTNIVTGGYFDFVDTGAVANARRFYRGRWVP